MCPFFGNVVSLGNVVIPGKASQGAVAEERLLQTHFVSVPSQLAILQRMMMDWLLGETLLLIGVQGSGKYVTFVFYFYFQKAMYNFLFK